MHVLDFVKKIAHYLINKGGIMRNLPQTDTQTTGRPVTMSTKHMAASSHYLASAAALEMLDRGGSAVDALIAANATLAVVYNHMAGLGGDLFAQVWDPKDGKVAALNGSGRSGEKVTLDV
jgi:gamma-glutamyltranspeptidase/glutathione hydrolase